MRRGISMGWLLVGALATGAAPLAAQSSSEQDSTKQGGGSMSAGASLSFLQPQSTGAADGAPVTQWTCFGGCARRNPARSVALATLERRPSFNETAVESLSGARAASRAGESEGPWSSQAEHRAADGAVPAVYRTDDEPADDDRTSTRGLMRSQREQEATSSPVGTSEPARDDWVADDFLLASTGGSTSGGARAPIFTDLRAAVGLSEITRTALQADPPPTITTVPEPATLVLLTVGIGAIAVARGRRRARAG